MNIHRFIIFWLQYVLAVIALNALGMKPTNTWYSVTCFTKWLLSNKMRLYVHKILNVIDFVPAVGNSFLFSPLFKNYLNHLYYGLYSRQMTGIISWVHSLPIPVYSLTSKSQSLLFMKGIGAHIQFELLKFFENLNEFFVLIIHYGNIWL